MFIMVPGASKGAEESMEEPRPPTGQIKLA